MALNLIYPLKKGTFHRVRGFKDHTFGWKGIDDGCKVGTPLYAVRAGKISHNQKISTGGGWNFRLNFNSPRGSFYWYAHCSQIPANGATFKQGQVVGKSGATGGVTGPHLHHSLLVNGIPKDPDNPNVVKWLQLPKTDMYQEKPPKYSDGRPKSAKQWFNLFVTERKRKITLQKQLTPIKEQIKELEKSIRGLQDEYTDARMKAVTANNQLEGANKLLVEANTKLKTCLQAAEKAQKKRKDPYQPIDWSDNWVGDLIKLIKGLFKRKGVR